MRSFLLLAIVALTLAQCTWGAQIVSVNFWNDSTCTTQPIYVNQTLGLTETPGWSTLPLSAVYDEDPAPCVNQTLASTHGTTLSGEYTCFSNSTTGGMLIYEYSQPSCQGSPAVIYIFLGPPSGPGGPQCVSGNIQLFPAAGGAPVSTNMYASVVCNNNSVSTAMSSSSSSTGVSGGNSTTGGGGGNGAMSVHSGVVVAVLVAVLSVLALLA